jgi:ubiquinone/menaquinone biosynthesis C-methylase UbiE
MIEIENYINEIAEFYDKDRFDNTYGKFIDYQERKILDKLITNKYENVLDLACGTVRLLKFANYGVDSSPKMIEIAKNKFKNKPIYLTDASNTQLESNTFDLIIIFHFFMHLSKVKIDEILEECYRILKKDGRIIFDIPSKKRRDLFNYKANKWHIAYSNSFDFINQNSQFKLTHSFGIMFLPIHRFPKFTRKLLSKFDLLLANSF